MGLARQEKPAKFSKAHKFCVAAPSRPSPVLPQFPLLFCVSSVLEKTSQTVQYLHNCHTALAVTKAFLL